MNSTAVTKLVSLSLLLVSTCAPASSSRSSDKTAVFVATTLCNEVSRRTLQVPTGSGCEIIKWNLTLNQDSRTLTPTTYALIAAYGIPVPGTTDVINGGTKVYFDGKWTIAKGTKMDANAVVYKLDRATPPGSISFVKLDQNLLHLLDDDNRLAVGDDGWSFTYSRVGSQSDVPAPQSAGPLDQQFVSVTLSEWPTKSSLVGRFVGRSPCREVAAQLNRSFDPDCVKVKWDLTLYRDPAEPAPTYTLKGTFFRDRVKEGTWTVLKGAKGKPEALVFQLDPGASQGSLLLLKADDNLLFFLDKSGNLMVGDNNFSYTLNRTN